jgi:hypothetical protein
MNFELSTTKSASSCARATWGKTSMRTSAGRMARTVLRWQETAARAQTMAMAERIEAADGISRGAVNKRSFRLQINRRARRARRERPLF